jgi:hypothetical protein
MFKFKRSQVVNEIYAIAPTDEAYFELGKITGNRDVKSINVRRIRCSMQKRNFLNCIPIIIDTKGRIIDGQHRYEAATKLGITIYVVMVEDDDVGSIAIALNTNKSNWNLNNFAHYWAEQEDNPEAAAIYQRFLDYKENNNITCGILIAIFNMKSSRGIFLKDGGNKDFKEGRLPFGTVNRRHIEDTLSKLRQLKEASLYSPILRSTFRKQQFQEAFLQAMKIKCFNFDKFLCKLCRSRHILNKLAKKTDIHDEIVRIYTKKGK